MKLTKTLLGSLMTLTLLMATVNTTAFAQETTPNTIKPWKARTVQEIKQDIHKEGKDTTIYTVVYGDTLSTIATALGIDLETLANINDIKNAHLIMPDNTLTIKTDKKGEVEEVIVADEEEVTETYEIADNEVINQSEAPNEPVQAEEPEVAIEATEPTPITTNAREAFDTLVAQKGLSAYEVEGWASIIERESNWEITASNPSSGAYGLAQALPAYKMSSHGDDWETNAYTQLNWMYDYMVDRYGSIEGAVTFWNANHWY